MATKLLFGTLAALSGTLALGSTLTFASIPASAFEIERGNHGASRIVPQDKSQAPQQTTKAEARRFPVVVRGNHGAQRIVNQKGIGGPVSTTESKGSPDLEGTVHAQDGWF